MKRRELEIKDKNKILEILSGEKVLHLALTDGEQPYVLPLNYGFVMEKDQLTLYLHGGMNGYKYELMRKNPKVSFAIEHDIQLFEGKVACQYGMTYSSLMGKGIIEILENPQDKMRGLSILMKQQTGKDFKFNEKLVSIVNVMKVTVTEYTGKNRPLPPVLEQKRTQCQAVRPAKGE